MTFSSKARNLAFSGVLAAAGCAGRQQVPTATPRTQVETRPESATERCMHQRTRIQNCIIEGIVSQCRSSGAREGDAFNLCVSDGLRMPESGSSRDISITVSQGDEVLSMRTRSAAVVDVYRLEAGAIDDNGINFTFDIDRVTPGAEGSGTSVQHSEVRMNFDGSRSGPWAILDSTLEVWNLHAQRTDSGRATVTFQTDSPTILVRSTTVEAPTRQQTLPPQSHPSITGE